INGIMQNMHPKDVDKVISTKFPEECRNPSGFVVAVIRRTERDVGRPLDYRWSGKSLDETPEDFGERPTVSAQLRQIQLVGCPGTKIRKHPHDTHRMQRYEHHTAIHFGYGKHSMHVNNSAGCTILLNSRFTEKHIKDITAPPPELHGRGGAITIEQGVTKLNIITAYSPRAPWDRRGLFQRRVAMTKVAQWVKTEVLATPSRFTPIAMMALNDRLVLGRDGDETVGPCPTGKAPSACHTEHKAHQSLDRDAIALGPEEGHERIEFLESLEAQLTTHGDLLDTYTGREELLYQLDQTICDLSKRLRRHMKEDFANDAPPTELPPAGADVTHESTEPSQPTISRGYCPPPCPITERANVRERGMPVTRAVACRLRRAKVAFAVRSRDGRNAFGCARHDAIHERAIPTVRDGGRQLALQRRAEPQKIIDAGDGTSLMRSRE
ncbi:unnamed protein product, partial [Prorocentrum cordatum]